MPYAVVGTRTIRSFHPRWPELGTEIHHSVGIGPLVLRDTTEVIGAEPPRLLVLEARIRPLGVLRVELRFAPRSGDTLLTIDETALTGPVALPGIHLLVDGMIAVRNQEMARRVGRLVEAREQQRPLRRAVA